MPGFFNGNKILFIGQNPGQPSTTDVHQNQEMSFDEHQIDYFKGFLRCRIGIYLKAVLKQLDFTIFDVGFTNIVKYSTLDNIQPTTEEADTMMPILKKQIELLNPEKIIAIGSFASLRLSEDNIKHQRIAHPASHRYSFFNVAKDVEIIRSFK
jgi:uracil-DNA glycosylase family 4